MTLVSQQSALGLLSAALLVTASAAAHSQEFATSVAASSHLSTNPLYSDPTAALGQPTTLINAIYDTPAGTYHRSMVFGAYNTDPQGNNLLVSLGSTGQGSLTVKFDTPIIHSDSHWYGEDFIVFGNQSFEGNGFVTSNTDMSQYDISNGATLSIFPTVSVSADGINFTTLTPADSVFLPENPYRWVGVSAQNPSGWDDSSLQDFSKPVDPTLTAADFAGQSVAYAANDLYNGSAGGTAFSLANTPFASTGIEYIRFTGTSAVIDGVSRVSDAPVPEASTFLSLSLGLLVFAGTIIHARKRSATTN